MRLLVALVFGVVFALPSYAQQLDKLTVEKIMRDPQWMGTSPSNTYWSADGNQLFFLWNPDNAPSDSLYYITRNSKIPVKASVAQKQDNLPAGALTYTNDRKAFTYAKHGDIYYTDTRTNKTIRITQTIDIESNPQFSFGNNKIVFSRSQNLYAWDIASGELQQLTNIRSETQTASGATMGFGARNGNAATNSNAAARNNNGNQQEDWLKKDQLNYFDVLRVRKERRDQAIEYNRNAQQKELRSINLEDKILQGLTISPDGRFVSYRLFKPASNIKATIVPSYVTETGFTTDIPGRTKVGAPQGTSELFLYDRERDTVWSLKTDSIPGIKDLPDYVKDYPRQQEERLHRNANRPVSFTGPIWSPEGTHAVLDIRSDDNKDRWLMLWDIDNGKLKLLDRQRDEAWIGGPGLFGSMGWIDEDTYWFQSEKTGYSHLYTIDVKTGTRKALSKGNYEVQQARLSIDKKSFYIITNEVHPGEQQFYKLNIATGKKERLTTMTGANQVTVSPDEKQLAILYSYSNKPWELFIQENKVNGKIEQVTDKAQSEEFKSYAWRDPEVITIPAADGAPVYARLYKPATPATGKPAVLFVHGAGYLQNAHKWWSSYFREYMFNNLLADNGYYVLDIDYRGSAGYGRDWRTGIYRHMGGKDLSDHVNAANYLVKTFGVDPKRIGIYGGSYGGFITLMGLFTTPDVFAAGAALRPVTDWANYNHGYTSNILNEPYNDSIAYHRSSPYYFASGLKNHLLICHGMMDVNVHFQDAVKLTQRLIELGKDNWQLAPYPMEDHGFIEPSSWTDEYKRIFQLFETVLKK